MRYDIGTVEDKDSYASVPEGVYECKVTDVRVTTARDGSERWSLRLVVVGGEYAGRTAAWDSITWSDRGVVRVKRVLEALGFDVSGEVELEARDLQGLQARVQVILEQYADPLSGRRQERMTVPYAGWGPIEATATNIDGTALTGEALAHGAGVLGDNPF
jgi:hypothetical protein